MLVELMPRVDSPRPPVSVLGPSFTLCIVNAGGGLRVFLESTVSPETLSRFYGVKKSSYEELLKVLGNEVWVGEARLKREFDFYYTDIVLSDLPGLINSLENIGGVCVSVSRDPVLKMVLCCFNRSWKLSGKPSIAPLGPRSCRKLYLVQPYLSFGSTQRLSLLRPTLSLLERRNLKLTA